MHVTKDVFEMRWEQIRAQSKVWWGLLSDDDLKKVEQAPIKRNKYAMLLRVRYGYSHEHAKEEITRHITELEADPPSVEVVRASPDRQVSSKLSKVRKNRTKNSKL